MEGCFWRCARVGRGETPRLFPDRPFPPDRAPRSKSYYDILQVSRTASDAQIKRAYRKLALQFHPVSGRWGARREEGRAPPDQNKH